jgi:hypothetical protein
VDENKVTNVNDYTFFFIGGSCGSFVKTIFWYYLTAPHTQPLKNLKINPITGDCHGLAPIIKHCHWPDQLDTTKKIISIDFDDDDKPIIARMAFWKVVTDQLARDPTILETKWDKDLAHMDPTNLQLLEKFFVENPDYLIFPDWKIQIEKLSPVLVIKFKDILFNDLNGLVASFLNVPVLTEMDEFIQNYRLINKKYLDFVH